MLQRLFAFLLACLFLFGSSPAWAASQATIYHNIQGSRVPAGGVNCAAIPKGPGFVDVLVGAEINGFYGNTDRGFRVNAAAPPTMAITNNNFSNRANSLRATLLPITNPNKANFIGRMRIVGSPPYRIGIIGSTPAFNRTLNQSFGLAKWTDVNGQEIELQCGAANDRLQKGFAANAIVEFTRNTGKFLYNLPGNIINGVGVAAGIGFSFLLNQLSPGSQY